MLRLLSRFRRDQSGASLLEVALVLPLAISLMIGSAEFGRGFWAYHMADKSMRAAARYLARVPEGAIGDGKWGTDAARILALRGCVPEPNLSRCVGAPQGTPLPPVMVSQWQEPSRFTFDSSIEEVTTPDGLIIKVVEVTADIAYRVELLTVLGLTPSFRYRVQHREPLIGE